MKIGHLSQGVNAGIGSSGGGEVDFDSGNFENRPLDFILDGMGSFLGLPAGIVGAVVFDNELNIF